MIILGFGLFLWRADAKGIWWDEGLSLYRAQSDPAYILSNRIDFPGAPTVDQHPPLYFLVLHAFVRAAGESDLILRFPSIFFATLLVPLVYALGVRLRGRGTGRVAALLAALSPFHLWYAQEARPYTMVAALGAASVLFLWHAATDRDRRAGAASGVLAALAVVTQYFAALVLLFEAVWALVLRWRKWCAEEGDGLHGPHARWWLAPAIALPALALVLALATVQPLLPMLARHRTYVPLGIILVDALNSFSLGLSVNLSEVWLFDVAFALVLLLGLVSLAWRPVGPGGAPGTPPGHRCLAGLTLLAGYLLVPALGIWVISLRVPVYMNSRYLIVSGPAFYLGVALGIDALWRWRRAAAVAALAVLLAGMGQSIQRYHRHERYAARQDYRGAAAYITANERVGDVIVVTGHENVVPFEHYYRGNLGVVASPARAFAVERIGPDLQALGESHGRLWLVECPAYVSDPKRLAPLWLEEHLRREDHRSFAGYYGASVVVHGYLADDPVLPGAAGTYSIGTFDGRLSLIAYTLQFFDHHGQPHQVAADAKGAPIRVDGVPAGNVVSAAFRVRALGELPELKASLRLVNAEGTPWAQRDREPLRVLSTRDWPTDGMVRFDADLPVPPGTPPGTYALHLVLYEVESQQPLAFHGGGYGAASEDESHVLVLGTVTVGRSARPFERDEFLGVVPPLRIPARYGQVLDLVAFDLAPRSLGRSDAVTLHLFWRLQSPRAVHHRVVLNWTDSSGRVVHTSSHAVVETDAPTALWRQGDALHGIVRLPRPDGLHPGEYGLHLLVHDPARDAHLWLRRGMMPWPGRNLRLGTITIRETAE